MSPIERKFHAALLAAYNRSKDVGYNANIFIQMLQSRGGLLTAKSLINSPKPSDGYTALYELGHLELTVEAIVIDHPEWHELFTEEELAMARKRLADYRYSPAE